MKKIAVFTGTRAEYGILHGIAKKLNSAPNCEFQLWAGGSHYSEILGNTYQEIEADGFCISEKLDFLIASDTAYSVTKSMANATMQAAEAIARRQPDIIVLLGDRFEALAVAQAALIANVPIAHIHGGELTEGAIDDAIRHAITKMATLHFTSTERYRQRVIQLGEQPDSVFNTGAPGLDNIYAYEPLSKRALNESLGICLSDKYFLVTFHPETATGNDAVLSQAKLIDSLLKFEEYELLITYPNADAQGLTLIAELEKFAQAYPERIHLFKSLGWHRYLSAVNYAGAVIGNSSSGIIEVPSLKVPTINLGDRQKGRIAASSVLNVNFESAAIEAAIIRVLSKAFKDIVANVENPYGSGNSSDLIVKHLLSFLPSAMPKVFYDLKRESND